ncbi:hypothetical protein [Streptomyces sp. NPDC002922]|uniref:hypothetical protein n=1 Tax=Streptomyces sp. NPDC002922 TaxID=3154439 RepID=UPI0033AFA5F6
MSTDNDQVWLHRGLGGHELRVQLNVVATPFEEAGQILALEADLVGFGTASGPRSMLARTTLNLAYTQAVTVHRVQLSFLLTSLQLHAIETGRGSDMRFELDLNATLPQAVGHPACTPETLGITIAKSRWEEQIAALGPSSAFGDGSPISPC